MIKKGLVVKLNQDHIIVMTDQGDYERIARREKADIGLKIMYTEKDVIFNPQIASYSKNYRKYLVAASLVFALIMGLILQSTLYTEPEQNLLSENIESTEQAVKITTIIAVDINPSFQLMANANDTVVKVKSMNDDAKTIDVSSVVGLNIEEAIEHIVYLADEAGFIDSTDEAEDYVLVTIIMADDQSEADEESYAADLKANASKVNELRENVQNSAALGKVNFAVTTATKEQLKEAELKKIPVGLYVSGIKKEMTIKDYFSKEEQKEAFKENGKVIDKKALKDAVREAKEKNEKKEKSPNPGNSQKENQGQGQSQQNQGKGKGKGQ
jgi:hypothetical protein